LKVELGRIVLVMAMLYTCPLLQAMMKRRRRRSDDDYYKISLVKENTSKYNFHLPNMTSHYSRLNVRHTSNPPK
jgi:hypothetical protein